MVILLRRLCPNYHLLRPIRPSVDVDVNVAVDVAVDVAVAVAVAEQDRFVTEAPILNHETLDAYRAATELLALAHQIVGQIRRGHGPMAEQLRRASLSIPFAAAKTLLHRIVSMLVRMDL